MDSNYKINTVKISELTPDDKNANKGTDYGKELMDNSFKKFGAGRSILIDKNNRIIAGNKSTQQCAEIGIDNVIIVETDGKSIVAVKRTDIDLDSKEGRELAIADNATQKANLEWDEDNLKEIVDEWGINADDWGIEFTDVIDDIIDEDEVPLFAPAIIKFGDIIELNNHRLLCGDSCNTSDVDRLVNGQKADLIFTDPPYDLEDIYTEAIFKNAKDRCHIFIMDSDRHNALRAAKYQSLFKRFFTVNRKSATGVTRFAPMSITTIIAEFRKGKGKFKNIGDGFTTLIESSVVHKVIPGTNFNQSKRVELPEVFILHYSEANEYVFDFFGGSGSTLIACEKNNRICFMNEFEPIHCDLIIKRWLLYMKELRKFASIKINGEEINNSVFF